MSQTPQQYTTNNDMTSFYRGMARFPRPSAQQFGAPADRIFCFKPPLSPEAEGVESRKFGNKKERNAPLRTFLSLFLPYLCPYSVDKMGVIVDKMECRGTWRAFCLISNFILPHI